MYIIYIIYIYKYIRIIYNNQRCMMPAYIHIRVRGQSTRITQTSQKLILASSSSSEKKEQYSNTRRAHLRRRGQSTYAVNRRCTTYVGTTCKCSASPPPTEFDFRTVGPISAKNNNNVNTAEKIKNYMGCGVPTSVTENIFDTIHCYTTNFHRIKILIPRIRFF